MSESFVCVNGLDLEAGSKAMRDAGWTCDMHEPGRRGDCEVCDKLHDRTVQTMVAAALGECIPATVETAGEFNSNFQIELDVKRFVSAWQPVKEDTDQ